MITQLLTAALLAVSMGSLKPDTPKRALDTTPVSITLGFDSQYDPDSGQFYLEGNSYTSNYQNPQTFNVDGVSFTCVIYGEFAGDDTNFSFELNFTSTGSLARHSLSNVQGISTADLHVTFPSETRASIGAEGSRVETAFENGVSFDFNFDWEVVVPDYSVTKTFNNCHDSGNTDYRVPDSFSASTLSNPYTILVVANDGYFFKRDGSSFSFSSGVVVSSVDYGANPTAPSLPYSEMMFITFSMPVDNVSMTFTAEPMSLAGLDGIYNDGYGDAKALYENTNQFAWLKSIWSGMASFFAIEILPHVSLGFLCFSPLLVVAILAIVRILKHD